MNGHGTTSRSASRVVNRKLLVLLLCVDVAFFVLHGFNRLSASRNDLFSLAVDGGYAEVFQYLKEFSVAIALLLLFGRTREGVYGAWALLFTYLLFDDALTIHETAGKVVAAHLTDVQGFAFRAQDFGELTVSALAGLVFLGLIGAFYVRSSEGARDVSKDLAVLVGLLVFFGVCLDLAHLALEAMHVRALTIVEDGGEMIAMSIAVSYVVHLVGDRKHAAGHLWRSTLFLVHP
jgi:hypothetical protein